MEKYLEIIKRNDKALPGSLIYYLHEQDELNEQAFWELYNSIKQVKLDNYDNQSANNITCIVNRIYVFFLKSIIWHLYEKDEYKMKNFPSEKLALYIDRFETVVDSMINGYDVDEEIFDKELQNPYEQC